MAKTRKTFADVVASDYSKSKVKNPAYKEKDTVIENLAANGAQKSGINTPVLDSAQNAVDTLTKRLSEAMTTKDDIEKSFEESKETIKEENNKNLSGDDVRNLVYGRDSAYEKDVVPISGAFNVWGNTETARRAGAIAENALSGVAQFGQNVINRLGYDAQALKPTNDAIQTFAETAGKKIGQTYLDTAKKGGVLGGAGSPIANVVKSLPETLQEASEAAKGSAHEGNEQLDEQGLKKLTSFGDKYAEDVVNASAYSDLNNGLWNTAKSVSQNVGQQVIPMALKLVPGVGQALSSGAFYLGAAGGATDEALADGADWNDAMLYGSASGALEAATELMGEGLGKAAKGVVGKLMPNSKVLQSVATVLDNNPNAKRFFDAFCTDVSEGNEEVVSGLLSPFLKSIYNGKSLSENWQEEVSVNSLWEQFLGGFLVSGIMQGAGDVLSNSNTQIENAQRAVQENGAFSQQAVEAINKAADAMESVDTQKAETLRQAANDMTLANKGDIEAKTRVGLKLIEMATASVQPSESTAQTVNVESEANIQYTDIPANQQTAQAAQEAQTAQTADLTKPVKAGKATIIRNQYQGEKPTQQYEPSESVVISAEAQAEARQNYANAVEESRTSNTPLKTILSRIYSKFKGSKGVRVNGMEYGGKPYTVDVPNNLPGKLTSQNAESYENYALLNHLEEIIQRGEYTGSGTATTDLGTGKKRITRYDYFETTVNLNGVDMIARWDVEVVPGANNYKTHRLVNIKIDPAQEAGRLVQQYQNPSDARSISEASSSQLEDSTSDMNIPQEKRSVNQNFYAMDNSAPTLTIPNVSNESTSSNTSGSNYTPSEFTANGTRTGQTAQTARDTNVTTEAAREQINQNLRNGAYNYIPLANDITTQRADAQIRQKGYTRALAEWTADVRSGKTGADITATGALLYNSAVNSGHTREAIDILTDYALLGKNTAQGLQAFRILQNLTPDGQLYVIQKAISKMNEQMSKQAEAKSPKAKNTVEKEITKLEIDPKLAEDFLNAQTRQERNKAVENIQKDIASKLPHSFSERWTALRYLNMLGNLRTQGRNILGNTGMMATAYTKNTLRYGIEKMASALSGGKYQRNTSLTVSSEMMDAARMDYDAYSDFINGDAKYDDGMTTSAFAQGVRDAKRPFTSSNKFANAIMKPLDIAERATKTAMTKGDTIFIKAQYARYLGGYLEAHGISGKAFQKVVDGTITPDARTQSIIDEGRAFAAKEAQEATFHDSNAVSDYISKIGRGDKTPKAVKVLAEGLMPFRKTPANVAVRAVEYSPLGWIDTTVKGIKAAKGTVSGSDFINSVSKSMTGTGLFLLGMLLRSKGLLRGSEDDEEQEAFDELQGKQDYSLQIGDTSITIDWLSPAAIPMFMGSQLYDAIHENGFQVSDFTDALTSVTDPLIQMSMLQGVNDTLDNIKYSDNNLIQLAMTNTMSYLMQGMTSTLLGQAERTAENKRYTTFLDGETKTEKAIQRYLGKASAKTPGWDYNQVEYVDAWGRTEDSGNVLYRAFENFVSPGYLSETNSTRADKELQRLYDSLDGEVNVYPQRIGMTEKINSFDEDGNRTGTRGLTADEYVQYQKIMGRTSLSLVNDLIRSPTYEGMSDEAKAEAIRDIYSYAKDQAETAIEPSNKYSSGSTSSVSQLSNPAAYYGALSSYNTATKNDKSRDYEQLDALSETITQLPQDVQDAVIDRQSTIGKLVDAKDAGISSEKYYTVTDSVAELTPADGYSGVPYWQKMQDVVSQDLTNTEKDYFASVYLSDSAYEKYMTARTEGYQGHTYNPQTVILAYQYSQTVKGEDKNGDGRSDTGTKKNNYITQMMELGATRGEAEYFYKLFS